MSTRLASTTLLQFKQIWLTNAEVNPNGELYRCSDAIFLVQVTMKVQAGPGLNRNGTYMEGLGIQYHQHRVIINVNAHDVLAGA